jgi:hypothetical protein
LTIKRERAIISNESKSRKALNNISRRLCKILAAREKVRWVLDLARLFLQVWLRANEHW